jgi:Icc-related predicted phosphoesterase
MNMKMLFTVDIHKSPNAREKILQFISKHKPDVLVLGGDITTFGPLEYANGLLNAFTNLPVLALPGNCDPKEILDIIDSSPAKNLHCKNERLDGVTIVGLGGSNSTPFNTPFELEEDEIFTELDSLMEPGAILILHFPVKGHLDLAGRGVHTGSTGALRIVEKYRPSLVLSGHIHEARGVVTDKNGTIYANPGPLKDGYAALVEISERIGSNGYDSKITLLHVD